MHTHLVDSLARIEHSKYILWFASLPSLSLKASGVTVSDVCKTTYEEIKKDKKHRYVIFYIRDEKQIDVETVADRNAEYDQFLEDIQKCGPGECR